MAVTIDPASLAEFFFIYPLQWWYYAVGVGVLVVIRFIRSSLKKKVEVDSSKSSPLRTAQEYAGENESSKEGQYTLGEPPALPQGGDGATSIDDAMETLITRALINSSPYARFQGLVLKTKFGEIVIDRPKEERPAHEGQVENIPPVPPEDQTEGN